MSNKSLVISVVAILIIAGGYSVFSQKNTIPTSSKLPHTEPSSSNIPTPTPSPNQTTSTSKDQSNANQCIGEFTLPEGSESFILGSDRTISWRMPEGDTYYTIYLTLLTDKREVVGSIIHYNWVKYNSIHSQKWDFKTIYTVSMLKPTQIQLQPGVYKFKLSYEYADSQSLHTGSCPLKGEFESKEFVLVK